MQVGHVPCYTLHHDNARHIGISRDLRELGCSLDVIELIDSQMSSVDKSRELAKPLTITNGYGLMASDGIHESGIPFWQCDEDPRHELARQQTHAQWRSRAGGGRWDTFSK